MIALSDESSAARALRDGVPAAPIWPVAESVLLRLESEPPSTFKDEEVATSLLLDLRFCGSSGGGIGAWRAMSCGAGIGASLHADYARSCRLDLHGPSWRPAAGLGPGRTRRNAARRSARGPPELRPFTPPRRAPTPSGSASAPLRSPHPPAHPTAPITRAARTLPTPSPCPTAATGSAATPTPAPQPASHTAQAAPPDPLPPCET